MTKEQIFILCADKAAAKPTAAKLAQAGFALAGVVSPAAYRGQAAGALVLLCDLQHPDDCRLVRSLYVAYPGRALILATETADMELMRRAVGCGIAAVVTLCDDAAAWQEAITDAMHREQARAHTGDEPAAHEGHVLSVFGTKGGTGKTTIAVNLALALAAKKRTALLDLDLQFGDVAVFMDINRADNIASLVESNSFSAASAIACMQPHPSGLMVLCAPSSPEYAELISAEHLHKIIEGLKESFDYIVLDMPPVFSEVSLAGLEASERIYFITNPDISTLRNTKVSLEVFDSIRMAQKVNLVINKQGFSSISEKTVCEILEKSPVFVVPHDLAKAVNAVNQGVPLVAGQPKCKISQAILRYAEALTASEAQQKKRLWRR